MFSGRANLTGRRGALLAVVVAALSLAACSSSGSGQGAGNGNGTGSGNGPAQVDSEGATRVESGALGSQLDSIPKADLTTSERDGLLKMREEEKLAHDVYVTLGNKWNLNVFDNISAAEQTHTDAVKTLLDRYALADPAAGNTVGNFTNPDLQTLYTELVSQGSGSLVAALTVGATIEDLDIADLQALATTTPDLALVYANLEKGSRNHLRAFAKQLDKNGATYTPTHITQAAYDEIVSSAIERGSAG